MQTIIAKSNLRETQEKLSNDLCETDFDEILVYINRVVETVSLVQGFVVPIRKSLFVNILISSRIDILLNELSIVNDMATNIRENVKRRQESKCATDWLVSHRQLVFEIRTTESIILS